MRLAERPNPRRDCLEPASKGGAFPRLPVALKNAVSAEQAISHFKILQLVGECLAHGTRELLLEHGKPSSPRLPSGLGRPVRRLQLRKLLTLFPDHPRLDDVG